MGNEGEKIVTKASAPEDKLGALHAKVADVMLKALDAIELANEKAPEQDDDGNSLPPMEPSAALLGAITKFLKDNNITCNTEDSQTMTGLQQRLKDKPRLARKAPAETNVVPLRELPVTEDDAAALEKLGLA